MGHITTPNGSCYSLTDLACDTSGKKATIALVTDSVAVEVEDHSLEVPCLPVAGAGEEMAGKPTTKGRFFDPCPPVVEQRNSQDLLTLHKERTEAAHQQAVLAMQDTTAGDTAHHNYPSPPPLVPQSKMEVPAMLKALREDSVDDVCCVLQKDPEAAIDVFMDHGFETPLACAFRLRCNSKILDLLVEHGASHEAAGGGQFGQKANQRPALDSFFSHRPHRALCNTSDACGACCDLM